MSALIEIEDLVKVFGSTRALDGVTLTVNRGEVVALLGHNGSGKSTLVKILDGVQPADAGEVKLHDTSVRVIHQSLGLIDSLSAIENLDIGRRNAGNLLAPFSKRRERAKIAQLLARFEIEIEPETPVENLTPAQRTIIAIVRALDGLAESNQVLVLDEPTATLHDEEIAILLDSIRSLAASGVGILYISHRLNEVIDLADRAIVLQNGRVNAEFSRNEYTQSDLLEAIACSPTPTSVAPIPRSMHGVALRVDDLHGPGAHAINFELRSGEILGIAGLIGSGMEQLNALIFGAKLPHAGTVQVHEQTIPLGTPNQSIQAGIGYLPADRLGLAGIREYTAAENLTLPYLRPLRGWHGGISAALETREAEYWMQRVKALPNNSSGHPLHSFSGGNQQKVLLAKWLRLKPSVLLLDEPTQGVDVGAQAEIRSLLHDAAAKGAAFVVASSDTRELAELCDRVLVIHDGNIHCELTGSQLSESAIIHSILAGKNIVAEATPE